MRVCMFIYIYTIVNWEWILLCTFIDTYWKLQRSHKDYQTMTSICIIIRTLIFCKTYIDFIYLAKPDLPMQLSIWFITCLTQPLESQHLVISSCCQYWLTVDYGGQTWSSLRIRNAPIFLHVESIYLNDKFSRIIRYHTSNMFNH